MQKKGQYAKYKNLKLIKMIKANMKIYKLHKTIKKKLILKIDNIAIEVGK